MENFIYGDGFYHDLGDLMVELEIEDGQVASLADDWSVTVREAKTEPLLELSVDWIMDRIDAERFSENGNESDKVESALKLIDFEAVNKAMPKMWYETVNKFEIKKKDLLDYIQ
jgi:hypothetical protein